MRPYKILCLTDHDSHSKENSIYALLTAMSKSERCSELYVASRSASSNKAFFKDHDFNTLFAYKVDGILEYEASKKNLHQHLARISPRDFDVIFLRLPRPVSDSFLLDLDESFSDTCIINKPSGILVTSSKAVLLNFPEVCPPIRLCKSKEEVLDFANQYDLVLKPLREYGGKGIVRIKDGLVNDGHDNIEIELYLDSIESILQSEGVLAMKYLKNVSQGDKRLIVVNGEILAASLRLPSKDTWLCNVAMGGTSVGSEAEAEEIEIIKRISPFLEEKGILIYGADTLVDDDGKRVLSEINTLSIGGFPQAEQQSGRPIIKMTIEKIFTYADVFFQ